MENKKILSVVKNVFDQIAPISRLDLEKDINLPLTGPGFYLTAFQLYEFLILIEKEFQIYFTYDEIQGRSLITLKDFADLINEKVSNRSLIS